MQLKWYVPIIIVSIFFTACENNIEVIKNLYNPKEIPSMTASDMEILFSDSGHLKMKVVAKAIEKYNLPEKEYIEFPKGMTVYEYDSVQKVISVIKANYARYFDKKKLWIARTDVTARNVLKNEQLNTEELFWDQTKAIIYSTKFTKIVNADGVFYGDGGFEAKEDLSKWHMVGIKGRVNVKDSENAQQNP